MNGINDRLEDVIYFLVEQTDRKAKAHSTKAFLDAGIDVSVDQWVLLKLIEQNPGISQTELAAMATKDTASITRMLDIIEKKGYVERQNVPNDRRKYLLVLTIEGSKLIGQHSELVLALRQTGVKGVSEEELAFLKRLLLQIQANLS